MANTNEKLTPVQIELLLNKYIELAVKDSFDKHMENAIKEFKEDLASKKTEIIANVMTRVYEYANQGGMGATFNVIFNQ